MNEKNRFWKDDSGRTHAMIFENVNADGTIGFRHIPSDSCYVCGMKILPYKKVYEAFDPTGGAIMHYGSENNYCEECAKKITGIHRRVCEQINIFGETVTYGGWLKEGWHDTTYIKSPGCEVSPEYDMECERIESDPVLAARENNGVQAEED